MGLNEVASGERLHIGFFGLRNAGKSSLVNAVTGQALSVVSDVKGTTTDPVKKAMELLPLGPVVIIDTPGLDDEGALGQQRIQKARQILGQTDIAVLVTPSPLCLAPLEVELLQTFQAQNIPYLIVCSKADLISERPPLPPKAHYVSAVTGEGVHALKEALGALAPKAAQPKVLIRDKVAPGDWVVLVMPIDEAAPKGRLILPQQMTLRELLDAHATVVTCQDTELKATLEALPQPPRMVITDSQAFGRVSKVTPPHIPLTSFSILMARYKGDLETLIKGAAVLKQLKNGDKVLICEGCTHHRQCNDIGTVKIPGWIRQFSGAEPSFAFTSGGDFPEDLSGFRLAVHCGGCTLNEAAMKQRMLKAARAGVPLVNYGIAIAQMHGILSRSLQLFPEVQKLLED